MLTVTVVIPLYNNEAYITRAIDSVLAQSFQDFELVVVDDGSTDSGPDLVMGYQDKRLSLIRQRNMGPGCARNRGLKESTAPYLSFLDSDDEWLPNFLSEYLLALTTNPECDYAVGPYFKSDARIDKSKDWSSLGMLHDGSWSLPPGVSHKELHDILTTLHFTGAMLCKRSAVEKYHGFYSKNSCKYGEDRYLQLQLLLNHKVSRIIHPLVWYHSETFGISAIDTSSKPLIPLLSDPGPIRDSCPSKFSGVLEDYLASHALGYAMQYAQLGHFSKSRELIRQFPLMKKYKRRFVNLVGKMATLKLANLLFSRRPGK
jgi:glycosyltransferase involved in cell wall biosynthesis